ncbi:MAG TPA: YqaA family protein [Alphaproteobacteria bacterium]|nr:YqaA family protein [Alphaproteobacteria bacterium]
MRGGLYRWTMGLAGHRRAVPALLGVTFAESFVFPIPADALMVPIVLAQRDRAWQIATLATIASVAGGLVGYAIGALLYDSLGSWLIALYGYQDAFAAFKATFDRWGLWIILVKGLTPIPYKIVTIASGLAQFDLPTFVLASLATRALRYYLLCGLLWYFGPPIQGVIERHAGLVAALFLAVVVGGVAAVGYLA